RPDEDEALLAAHDELGERDAPLRAHRVGEESIRLLAAFVRAEVVRLLEVDRVHRRERHELRDVDDLRRLALQRLELLVADADVLVLRELVPADERRAVHDLVADRAEVLEFDAGAALGVEQVERDGLRRGGRVELDRDRDQPERDRPGPDRVCRHRLHDSTMLPMMREGSIPPMDSVPQAAERRHLGVLTVPAAAVLLTFVLLMTWLHLTGSPVGDMAEPERALAVVVGRSLDLDDGIDGAPAWERRFYRWLVGRRADDLADALLARLRALTAVEVTILAAALVTLASWVGHRGERARSGAAPLPPPWRVHEGLGVLVRGGALGAILLVALSQGASAFLGGRAQPYQSVVVGAATTLAFLPLILMARRRLLRPSGLGLVRGFGLALTRANTGRLLGVALVLVAAGQLGDWTLGAMGRAFEITSHWTEWFDRDLVWGARPVVIGTLVDTVVLTPVF